MRAPYSPDWLPLLRDALAAEGRCRLPLRGDSMAPTLPAACEIEIAPLGGAPRLGALIVFAQGAGLVAHRLAWRAGGRLFAQGDHRRAADPPLLPEQVLGVVAAAWVDGRRVWPRRGERIVAAWWVARAWMWRGARSILRM